MGAKFPVRYPLITTTALWVAATRKQAPQPCLDHKQGRHADRHAGREPYRRALFDRAVPRPGTGRATLPSPHLRKAREKKPKPRRNVSSQTTSISTPTCRSSSADAAKVRGECRRRRLCWQPCMRNVHNLLGNSRFELMRHDALLAELIDLTMQNEKLNRDSDDVVTLVAPAQKRLTVTPWPRTSPTETMFSVSETRRKHPSSAKRTEVGSRRRTVFAF